MPTALPISTPQPNPAPVQSPGSVISSGRPPSIKPLNADHINIWEETAQLYHDYEWRTAADVFDALSQATDIPDDRAKCLINSGLIRARLGDHIRACRSFEAAAEVAPHLLLATYLTAIVSCELGDYAKAEACLNLCLEDMEGTAIDYTGAGLHFVLQRSSLLEDLRQVREARFRQRFLRGFERQALCLSSIPAQCIFEAPPRPPPPSTFSSPTVKAGTDSSRRSSKFRNPLRITTHAETPIVSSPKSPDGPRATSPYWSHDPTSPSSPLCIYMQPEPGSGAVSPKWTSLPPRPPGSGGKSHWSWHRRSSTTRTPLENQMESGPVHDSVKYAQISGDGKMKAFVPRDATGEYESVDELARFLVLYAPE